MAEIIRVDALAPDRHVIDRAAACLRDGGLVAFPTETVYGLGADATNRTAVLRIFETKGRPSTDPLIVHVSDLAAARRLVTVVPDIAEILAKAFWPGPLTLVFARSSLIGDEVTAGLPTVAIRVPSHEVARALVTAAGVPVAAPSANLFSRPSPTRAEHVADDLGNRIDLILDAGPTGIGLESTVLDLTREPPVMLRPGGVTAEQLREHVPALVIAESASTSAEHALASPGMLTKHYAPSKPMTVIDGEEEWAVDYVASEMRGADQSGHRLVLLGSREMLGRLRQHAQWAQQQLPPSVVELGSDAEPDSMARHLYAALRECDRAPGDIILAFQVADTKGIGLALRDRLRRASAGNVITGSKQ